MSALTAELGLDDGGFIAGMKRAEGQTGRMESAVNRMIQRLTAQNAELSGTTAELERYQAAQNRATPAQLAALNALQKSIEAEKAAIAERKKQEAATAAVAAAEAKRKATLDSMIDNIGAEHAAIGKSSTELKLMELRSMGASNAQLQLAESQLRAVDASNRQQTSVMGLTNRLTTLATAMLGIGGLGAVTGSMDEWTTLNNRLKLVTNSSMELVAARDAIINSALATGQSLDSVGSVYQSLARNQDALGLSGEQMATVMDTINKSMVIGGGDAAGNAAALAQLGQALGSGVLRGDEFNSMMEQTPGLAKALADGLGVPVGALRNMANEGKLTAKVVTDAMLKASNQVNADFSKMDLTISQSAQNLKTSFTQFVGGMNDSTGASKVLSGAIGLAAKNIDVLAAALTALVALQMGKWMLMGAANTVVLASRFVMAANAARTAGISTAFFGGAVQTAGVSSLAAAGQVTTFSGALGVLRGAAVSSYGALAPFFAAMLPFAAAAAALTASLVALKAAANFAQGKSAENWIHGLANSIAGLDNETESLGTRLADAINDDMGNVSVEKVAKIAVKFTPVGMIWSSFDKLMGNDPAPIEKDINANVKVNQEQLSAQGIQLRDDIAKISGEFQTAAKNFGMTAEEIKLLEAQTKLETLAKEKGSAAAMEAAKADLLKAQDAYVNLKTSEQLAEQKKQEAQLQAQNAQAVQQSIHAKQTELQTMNMSTSELMAFNLAVKGASPQMQAYGAALVEMIESTSRFNAVMADLEGLDKQIARLGKSDIEVKLMDLRDKGANQQQLDYARKQLEYLQQYKAANTSMKSSTDLMKTNATLDGQSATSFASGVDRFGKSVDALLGKSGEQAKEKVPQVQYFGPRGSNATETLAASKPTGLANLGTIKLELGDGNQKLSELIKTDSESAKAIMKLVEEANKRQLNDIRKRVKN